MSTALVSFDNVNRLGEFKACNGSLRAILVLFCHGVFAVFLDHCAILTLAKTAAPPNYLLLSPGMLYVRISRGRTRLALNLWLMAILAFLVDQIADFVNNRAHVVVHRIDPLELLMLQVPGEIIIEHSSGSRAENLISNG